MIIYNYNANTIIGEPIPDRKSTTLQNSFLVLFQKVKLKGYKPTIIRLDNKIAEEYFSLLETVDLKVQLVLPYKYCQNLAEHAIQIYKNYLIASLSGADPNFLLIL